MAESKRPKHLSDEDRRAVATELVDDIITRHSEKMPDRADAIDDIARCAGRHMDGYEMAKALDDIRYWDCDLDLAEDLDGWSCLYDEKLRERQKEWAATVDFGAPFKPGTRVTATWCGQAYTGNVKEIYEYGPAQYVVEIDGRDNKGGGAIVDFENVTLLEGNALAKAMGSA